MKITKASIVEIHLNPIRNLVGTRQLDHLLVVLVKPREDVCVVELKAGQVVVLGVQVSVCPVTVERLQFVSRFWREHWILQTRDGPPKFAVSSSIVQPGPPITLVGCKEDTFHFLFRLVHMLDCVAPAPACPPLRDCDVLR